MLVSLACIVVLGVGSQWLAWRFGLPSILLLLAAGVLAGPVARAITPDLLGYTLSIDPKRLMSGPVLLELVSLAVAVILFEGGLTLALREIAGLRRVVMSLVTVGAVVTWLLSAAAAHFLLDMSWSLASLFGAVLVVTGPTVIGPLLRFVRPTGRVGSVLRWEGIVIDPIGAMLAVLVFEVVLAGHGDASGHSVLATMWSMARGALLTMSVGTGIGCVVAWVLVWALSRYMIPDRLQVPVTLAAVVLAFTASNELAHESGLFATTVMGLVMANQKRAPIRHILEFKEVVTTLLIATLFVILSARMELASLSHIGPGMIGFMVLLIVLIRPASVLIATISSSLSLRERLFIGGLAPRGIVAASVASVFALRLQEQNTDMAAEAMVLVPFTFVVVATTVMVYGLGAAPLARRCGLSRGRQSGFLIIGGEMFGQEIAAALAAEGADVLLVDTNLRNIREARLRGIPVLVANALSSQVVERISLSPIGRLLAMTSNHEVNSLATMQYGRLFGRENVFQLAEKQRQVPGLAGRQVDRELIGRTLFAADADHDMVEQWIERGARVRKTRLSETFNLNAYLGQHGQRAMPLFVVSDTGIFPVVGGEPIRAKANDQIISLMLPASKDKA